MKKSILIFTLLFSLTAKSQDFYNSLGIGFLAGTYNQEYTSPYSDVTSNVTVGVPGIMYKGTLGFEVSRSTSFGITLSPFLGFNYNNQGGSYFGFQIPLMGEFYFGDIDDNCFYLGGGFSYGNVKDSSDDGGPVLGPILGLGGQLEIADRIIGLRANYTFGVNKESDIPSGWEYTKDSRGMFSVSLYYTF
jgi:hypothetical protein